MPPAADAARALPGDLRPRWFCDGCEPTIAELADGTLRLCVRTSGPHHAFFTSHDGGETWEGGDGDPAFGATNTMPYFFRLSDGRLLFFWNNTAPLPTHAARITDSFPTNIRKGDEFGAPYNVTRRLFGHPFTVSEYNYCPPWSHRSSCAFLCGAAAALQDWSVLWRFCWTCSERNAVDSSKKSLNHFDMAGDPVATATERAIFCLFMRRDLPELETALATLYPPSALARPGRESADPTSFDGRWATWRTKLGGLVAETPTPGMTVFRRFGSVEGPRSRDDLAALLNCKFGEVVTSPNGEVKVDRARGSITVDTPRTAGGFVDKPGTVETSRFRAEIEGGSASAWVSSLDRRPIKETDRLLVCLVGDVQNDGIEYEDETMRVLRRWGKQEGRIARRVAAAISVSLANAPGWRVFALNPDGSRKREVESVFRDGRLSFRADIGGDPEEAEFAYEVAREP